MSENISSEYFTVTVIPTLRASNSRTQKCWTRSRCLALILIVPHHYSHGTLIAVGIEFIRGSPGAEENKTAWTTKKQNKTTVPKSLPLPGYCTVPCTVPSTVTTKSGTQTAKPQLLYSQGNKPGRRATPKRQITQSISSP